MHNLHPKIVLGGGVSEDLLRPADDLAEPRFPIWWISPGQSATSRAIATLKSLLPLARDRFERRFLLALEQAADYPGGFFLEGYAARRALGSTLVIDVDPLRLTQRMRHRSSSPLDREFLQDKFIGSGPWHSRLISISATATHRDVQEVIGADFDYRNTQAYRYALKRAGGRRPVRRNFVALKSPQLVDAYFRQIVTLCRSIRKKGVRRRENFRRMASAFKHPAVRLPWVELMEADIGIAIGPKGELYHFGSGKHRTAAAQAFGLSAIPVEVRLVHLSWLRSQIAKSGLSPLDALLYGIRSLDLDKH